MNVQNIINKRKIFEESGENEDVVIMKEWKGKIVTLNDKQVESIKQIENKFIEIYPEDTKRNKYKLICKNTIGVLHVEGKKFIIQPKIEIKNILFLLSYGAPDYDFDQIENLQETKDDNNMDDLIEMIIKSFLEKLERALKNGTLQSYRTVNERLDTIRGKVDFSAQITQGMGMSFPVHVEYDELTEDIDENRILKSAIKRILRLKDINLKTKTRLNHCDCLLQETSYEEYTKENIPKIAFNHLNEHYKQAIDIARFILLHSSFSMNVGETPVAHFLVYMPKLFEDFILVALRKCKALSSLNPGLHNLPQGKPLGFDQDRTTFIKPDLSFWIDGKCVFVGDVKYKLLKIRRSKINKNSDKRPLNYVNQHKHAKSSKNNKDDLEDHMVKDIYQVLAYITTTSVFDGFLIYAEDRTNIGHKYPNDNCTISIYKDFVINTEKTDTKVVVKKRAININASPENVLNQIEFLGKEIFESIQISKKIISESDGKSFKNPTNGKESFKNILNHAKRTDTRGYTLLGNSPVFSKTVNLNLNRNK